MPAVNLQVATTGLKANLKHLFILFINIHIYIYAPPVEPSGDAGLPHGNMGGKYGPRALMVLHLGIWETGNNPKFLH